MSGSEILLFGGQANPLLYEQICKSLGLQPGRALVSQFSDGETRVELQETVQGADVFVIQSTCAPANHHIMEALVIVDACRRASARTVTLVTPYFGYARQEREAPRRTSVTAKLVAGLIEAAGISRLLTLELHNPAIQGFFNIPVEHLSSKSLFYRYFYAASALGDMIVVSPDAGGVERARSFAEQFHCDLAIIDKRRDRPNESAVRHLIGDVTGRDCLVIDDIVDTGGSLVNAANTLLEKGARIVRAAVTHPVLSGSAVSRIKDSALEALVVTDSIPLSKEAAACEKIVQVSIAASIADAIRRIRDRISVSSLII